MKNKYIIIGAGFSGAVLARELVTSLDCEVEICDIRKHVAGNCHTERDEETGVLVHRYGPHIFNTNSLDIWKYVNKYGKFGNYVNRVKASTNRGVFSMPINLHTINQFFGKRFSPSEAKSFIGTLGDSSIKSPQNFEEQALSMIGKELYDSFFYGYTKKQWGLEPTEIPASVLKRLPVRFNYDDNYYNSEYQGIPLKGYTSIVENILDHPSIKVNLNTGYAPQMINDCDHLFYTGSIDRFFESQLGKLEYRTVYWKEERGVGDLQGNAVINYPEMDVEYTRIHEHKHFTPWENHEKSIIFTEYSKRTESNDIPYYPVRRPDDINLLNSYYNLLSKTNKVSFLGRLGTYRYLDMDDTIGEAKRFADKFVKATRSSQDLPKVSYNPNS